MTRVLIVDDELMSRMMVRSLIDWKKEGYVICGECSDGGQAWDLLPKLRPQIVITDVKMNRMDGDELVRKISTEYPEICTIVLSGYDDYKYVRDVLKHKAVDYLIKNDLTPEVLLKSLKKAEEILKTGPSIKKDENNMQALRRQFVLRLISGEYCGKEDIMEKDIQMLSIDVDKGQVVPVLLTIGDLEEKVQGGMLRDRMLILFSVCNVLEEIIREEHKGLAVSLESNEILILFSLGDMVSEQKEREEIQKIVNRSSFCLKKFLGLKGNFHIGKVVCLKEIQESFLALESQRKTEFLDLKEERLSETEKEYNEGNGIRLEDEQKMTSALRKRDKEALEGVLENIFAEIREEKLLRMGCRQLFSDLIVLSISFCKKQGISYERIYSHGTAIMEHVARMEKLSECRDFFMDLFMAILNELEKMGYGKEYSVPVNKAITYIHQYYKKGISLGDAAEYAGMNSSYLSTLFKSETGMGFVEYLNEVRLERAREYMDTTDMKLKEVIACAGFYSQSNFFNLFKKKYGMTPKEYQRTQN